MAKTYEELLEQAAIIRDETVAGKNTATRVGGTITDAVDYVKALQDTYSGIHAEASEAVTTAAAAKVTAAEAKTSAASAFSNARSAVLTANAAKATADGIAATAQEAKEAAEEAKAEMLELVGSLGEEDSRLNGLIAANTKKIASVEDTAIKARDTASAAATKNAEQDARLDALQTLVKELGAFASLNELLAAAADFDIASNPDIAMMHGTYIVAEGRYSSVIITQQVITNADGSGTAMQYYAASKKRYSRYINFTATGIAATDGVQPAQCDVPRNLVHSGTLLKMTDMWGGNVGQSVNI